MKTNWMKRMLCLMLSAVLLLGHIPASAFAEEAVPPEETVAEEVTEAPSEPTEVTEPETSEPTEPETSEPTEPEVTEPETSAPVEETSEPTEETQPEIPEVETVEEWAVPDVEDWPSDEELFGMYAEGLLYGNMPATFGTAAGERLTGNTKLAYDALKPYIQRIARGEVSDTSITMGYSHYNITVDGDPGPHIVDVEVPFVGMEFDSYALMHALLADMPYELYWFDKTTGMNSKYIPVSPLQWTVSFPVSGNYAPSGATGGYTADTAKTGAAATAAANAASVVAAAANLSDYEKLVYYKEYICGAVSYDWDAYEGSKADKEYYKSHIDPWQLIHVFDGNTSTNVVCEGYSKAFQYLCDLTDFDGDVVCYSVSGVMASSSGTGGHMWNIVSIGGESYLVDVTNSDDGSIGEDGGLFLVGGTMSDGAYYFTIGSQQIAFAYDSNMESQLGSDVITLSTNAEYEPPVEEAACDHAFSDGSCTKCGILGGTCGDSLYWTVDDAGLLTIYGTGAMSDFSEGTAPWYKHRTKITKAIVETGVTTIGNYAFFGCYKLEEVEIPEGVTAIGGCAFLDCTKLAGIVIPEGVTNIGHDAFENCSSLAEVVIPEGVTSIGSSAFYNCSSLKEVVLPKGVTGIGSATFQNCSSLIKVVLPEGVTKIEAYAFYGCTNLKEVVLPEGLTSIGIYAFQNCSSLAEVVIPEGVTSIGYSAFYNCSSLKEVVLPKGVTSIGSRTFQNCSSLTEIVIPDGVIRIGDSAFYNCSSLAEVVIPEGVTSIGGMAFSGCSSLAEVVIPEGVTSIGDRLFENCISLTEVVIPEGVTSIGERAFAGCSSLEELEIPEGVTSIGNYAFQSCSSLTELVIPEGVTGIGVSVFESCKNLTEVVIPEGVTSIGQSAFSGCSSLTAVVIPEGVTTIEYNTFYNCSSLAEVVIPEGVTNIGNYAFDGCSSLEELEIPESVTGIGNFAFSNCTSLVEMTFPENLATLDNSVFYDCTSMNKIVFTGDAPAFNSGTFRYITATAYYPPNNATWTSDVMQDYGGTITWVEAECEHEFADGSCTKCGIYGGECGEEVFWMLEDGLLTIYGSGAMNANNTLNIPWKDYTDSIKKVEIEAGVTSICDSAFSGCSELVEVVIPESVTNIESWAFDGCSGLTELEIPEGVTSIGKGAFFGCSGLTEVRIPLGITSIGDNTFQSCTSLTHVVIPGNVASIGYQAFYGCTSLAEVVISEGVTSIDGWVFYKCSMKEVVIPESVTSIGGSAFCRCSDLEKIIFMGDAPAFDDDAFYNVTATAYYPANNATWTSAVKQNYGGTITWMSGCAGNHAEVIDEGKPATCTETGLTEGKHCSACGEVIEAQEVIPALGHRVYFQEAVEYDPLRVENEDQIPFTLTDGTYYSANHDHSSSSELRIVAEESCSLTLNYGVSSEGGWDKLYILHNDEEKAMISGDVTDRLLTLTLAAGDIVTVRYTKDGSTSSGQDQGWVTLDYEHYSYGVGDVPADILHTDCTHDVVCTYCDTVVKKAPGHNTVIDERLEPTCKDDGLTEGSHCSVCGEVFTAQEVIPATGEHTFVDDACTGCGIYGDQCGENVYWIFEEDPDTDERTGVLTVYGEGPMYDFEHSIWEDFYPYKPFSIRKIVMEEGVTSIGNWAFGGCENMTEVVLPEGITSIGDGAFGGCRSLTEIVIPEGVTCIGEDAFSWCENLTSVVIPGSVTTIGRYAFYDCPNLQFVTLSEGLETIGEQVFVGCLSLTSIEIPGTVTSLGGRVFDECWNLKEIILCEGIPAIGEGAFYGCSVTSIEIPGSVKRIGSDAFRDCENLTEVILNEGLETIDDWAFAGSGLKEIVLPESITDFSGAFIECMELEKVVLPESLTAIGEQAFLFCRSLTDIVIPENVTGIGQAAFSECSALTEILIPGSVASISDAAFSGCTGLETLVISENVTEISGSAFSYCSALTEVVIPESVATVGRAAFIGCSGLEKVEFRGSTTDIGENAFMNCSSLAEITFPEDITYIDSGMFQNCTSLTEIVIPEKVVLLENAAFSGCAALTKITFPGNAPAIDGDVFSGVTAVAYYSADNATWTGDKLRNYGGDITWTPIGEQPPVAQIGGKNYTSLDQALSAAKKGDTVTLIADAETGDLMIRSGITVDLNGHTLTASYVVAFKGADISDSSTNGAGLLVVDSDCVVFGGNISRMPVWTGEGFAFAKVTYNKQVSNPGKSDAFKFMFKPYLNGKNSALDNLLDDGATDNNIEIIVRISWVGAEGVGYQNFVYNEEQVKSVFGKGNAFNIIFSEVSELGLIDNQITVEAIVRSSVGVEIGSGAIVPTIY